MNRPDGENSRLRVSGRDFFLPGPERGDQGQHKYRDDKGIFHLCLLDGFAARGIHEVFFFPSSVI